YECYRYNRPGHRLRKIHFSQTNRRTLRAEVRYLPNLEIHRQTDGEEHHVVSIEAGRSSVRTLHWPDGAHDDQLRYSLSDHLRSSTLELDGEAGVLTQERYYAFGGTACWAGKTALVAQYKTIRYSGKEMDATGLYHYGYRYYAPWLQRWINPDPFGDVDGLNIYRSFNNGPITFFDAEGTVVLNFSSDPNKRPRGDGVVNARLVVDYEIPKMRPGPEFVYYLSQSRPGNSFTGIANVELNGSLSGVVDIYPLKPNPWASASEQKTSYEGSLHDAGVPIEHGGISSGMKVAHRQAMEIFSRPENFTIGFTLNDVRDLPFQTGQVYKKSPTLIGTSRSINKPKTYRVSEEFVSVGANIDDYNKAYNMFVDGSLEVFGGFEEISIEVKAELLKMFATVSDTLEQNSSSLRQLFEAELFRPELQVPRRPNHQNERALHF
ncbi:RHS repeat-associated core domain-containing protein, partial [Pseudomonas sp. PD9R]|uniref:RHS repeat-associated core domain-containing protein n=1 Tax=Pseudomonas sp. PD9R TaxID=2853534 RepID=UPI001C486E76